MNLKRAGLSIGVVIIVVLVGTFVFGSKTLDTNDLEQKLTADASKNLGAPEDKITISCPDDDIKAEKGTKFDCDADVAGRQLILGIELTSDNGDYTVTPRKASGAAPKG